jgi:chorismate synthase
MLGAVVEGVPAGLALTEDDLAVDLGRRQRGYGRGARQSIEQDRARILSGVRHGLTLGSPILLEVDNRDWANWTRVMQVGPLSEAEAAELAALAQEGNKRAQPITRVRPGHADLAGALKYGFNDVRNALERSSARETTARVAAGGVARAFLRALGIEVWSFTAEVGGVAIDPARCTRTRDEADASPLRCPDPEAEAAMIARIDEARSNGDTVGGVFEVVVHGAPVGLGSYVHWDRRLDGALAAAVMSINIVKGVELGLGFEQTRRFGSAVHDVIEGRREDGTWIHRTNNAGGLTGGVTNGEPIVIRGAVKPISTLARPLPTADLVTGEGVEKAHYERSDISVVPAAGVIGEAMVMLTLARFVLEKTGGDSMPEVLDNLRRAQERMAAPVVPPAAGDGSGGHARPGAPAVVGGSSRLVSAATSAPVAPATDPDAGEAGSGGDD